MLSRHQRKLRRLSHFRRLPHDSPNQNREQQHEQSSGNSDDPRKRRSTSRSFDRTLRCRNLAVAQESLDLLAQLGRSNVQGSTFSNGVEKIKLSREDRCTRLTLRQMSLDSCTINSLQLVIEIQRQTPAYVVALVQTSLTSNCSDTCFGLPRR